MRPHVIAKNRDPALVVPGPKLAVDDHDIPDVLGEELIDARLVRIQDTSPAAQAAPGGPPYERRTKTKNEVAPLRS